VSPLRERIQGDAPPPCKDRTRLNSILRLLCRPKRSPPGASTRNAALAPGGCSCQRWRLYVCCADRAVADKGHTIRVPVHMGEKMRKMARVYNELSAELSRDPTDEQVAERIGWDVDRVKDVKSAIPDATSLNRPLSSLARHGSHRGGAGNPGGAGLAVTRSCLAGNCPTTALLEVRRCEGLQREDTQSTKH
jgi:hypothetical protein